MTPNKTTVIETHRFILAQIQNVNLLGSENLSKKQVVTRKLLDIKTVFDVHFFLLFEVVIY